MSAAEASRSSFVVRVVRTSLLHADTYEEVEADRSAIWQALGIVLATCAASVFGAWMQAETGRSLPEGALPLRLHLVVVAVEPLLTWGVSSAFAYMVGATFFRGPETETDYLEVLRTTGFAFAPGMLAAFAWVEPEIVSLGILAAARVWVLLASVVAVRQALDFTTLRAVATYGSAFVLMFLVIWGLTAVPF